MTTDYTGFWGDEDTVTATLPHIIPKKHTALDSQQGGAHYVTKGIQPIQYIHANNLGFCEGNIVKYATRWKDKNGLEDLLKIKHYVDLLIELEKLQEK